MHARLELEFHTIQIKVLLTKEAKYVPYEMSTTPFPCRSEFLFCFLAFLKLRKAFTGMWRNEFSPKKSVGANVCTSTNKFRPFRPGWCTLFKVRKWPDLTKIKWVMGVPSLQMHVLSFARTILIVPCSANKRLVSEFVTSFNIVMLARKRIFSCNDSCNFCANNSGYLWTETKPTG